MFGEIFYWMKGLNCIGIVYFFEDLNFIYDLFNCLNFYYSWYFGLFKNWYSISKLLSIIYRWLRISFRNWINVDVILMLYNGDEYYVFFFSNGRWEVCFFCFFVDFFVWFCICFFFISFFNFFNIFVNLLFLIVFDDCWILLIYFFFCISLLKKKMMKSRWYIDE